MFSYDNRLNEPKPIYVNNPKLFYFIPNSEKSLTITLNVTQ